MAEPATVGAPPPACGERKRRKRRVGEEAISGLAAAGGKGFRSTRFRGWANLCVRAKLSRYWEFLAGLVGLLALLHLLLRPTAASLYTQLIGYVGLAVEAVLPLPQMVANTRARSCKGFRVSVLANWLVGDAMKMSYFFTSAPGRVPWAFKACGIFQACCDAGLGVQWWVYGDGAEAGG